MPSRKPLPCAPGPRGVALWHSLRRMRRDALTEYRRLREQFGDVVRLATLPHPVYLVSHPDAVHYVLRENAHNYRKGLLFKPIMALQGQGLLTSEGDLWVRQRRLVQPAFHRRQLATFAAVMVDEARAVVREWRQPRQTGTPVNVAERMNRLTFNVVGRVLLGADPGALHGLPPCRDDLLHQGIVDGHGATKTPVARGGDPERRNPRTGRPRIDKLQERQGDGPQGAPIRVQRAGIDPEEDTPHDIEGQSVHPFGHIDRRLRLHWLTPLLHHRSGFVHHDRGERGQLPPVKGRLHQTPLPHPEVSLTGQQPLALQGRNGPKE